MAVPLPSKLTYSELYGDATMNPFGTETKAGYGAVFHSLRVETRPPTVDRVLEDAVVDFSRPIGGIGVFVEDDESSTGHLEVAHGNPTMGSQGDIHNTARSPLDSKATSWVSTLPPWPWIRHSGK
jgi:hypothetical protein